MNDAPRQDWRPAAAICGLLLLLVVVVFGQTVWHDFVYDDRAYVYDNPHVTQGLTQETIAWSFTAVHASNWHPLTWLSHALDCQLYGTKLAAGHHLTNVVLHAAVAILLFLVLWRMTGSLWPSALAAAVFAVHPLRVESVAWVTERKDLLSGLFFMLTLAAYLNYVRHPFSLARYLLVAASFALGLMAKPMLVTLPFVLLLLDYWPLGRMASPATKSRVPKGTVPFSLKRKLGRSALVRLAAEKIPLAALAAVSCIVTSIAQRNSMAVSACLPISSRIANALVSYVGYIGQFFYPAGLAVFYPHPESSLPGWKIAAAVLVLCAISAAAWIERRRFPYLIVGWLWYLGMLVPVIGLVQVGDQAMADRYTYLPEIGLCIALAWGTAQLAASWPQRRWICGVAAALAVVILAGVACRQTAYWRNDETLWTRAVDCTGPNATAEFNLGIALMQRGDTAGAMRCFQQTIAIQPHAADAQNILGVLLAKDGRIDEAVDRFQAALRLRPNDIDARNNLDTALAVGKQGGSRRAGMRSTSRLRRDCQNLATTANNTPLGSELR